MVRVKHHRVKSLKTYNYTPLNEGKLDYEISEGRDGIDLTWQPILGKDPSGKNLAQGKITYTVVASKDPRARLDSQCALKKEMA
jgi:hypothetical protein